MKSLALAFVGLVGLTGAALAASPLTNDQLDGVTAGQSAYASYTGTAVAIGPNGTSAYVGGYTYTGPGPTPGSVESFSTGGSQSSSW